MTDIAGSVGYSKVTKTQYELNGHQTIRDDQKFKTENNKWNFYCYVAQHNEIDFNFFAI